MWLHIGKAASKQFRHPFDCKRFRDVDKLTTAVIAFARETLGVLVGEHGALRLEHGAAHNILRRDQLDFIALATELTSDDVGDFRVGLGERPREEIVGPGRGLRLLGYGHLDLLDRSRSTLADATPSVGSPAPADRNIWRVVTAACSGAAGEPDLELSQRETLEIGLSGARGPDDRNFGAGRPIDGDNLYGSALRSSAAIVAPCVPREAPASNYPRDVAATAPALSRE